MSKRYDDTGDIRPSRDKAKDRRDAERGVAEFLARGGKVEQVPHGASNLQKAARRRKIW